MIFFTMIIVGLVFALLLGFVKNINQGANRFLALALVSMVLWMARVLVIDIWPGSRLPVQSLLALGPLLYFYVLKITRPKYNFKWKDLLHFSPLVLEQAMLPFQQLNPVLQLLIFISIITYLYKSYKLILHYYTRQPIVMMDRSRLEFRWLRRLLAATALLWWLWIVCAAIDYFGFHNQLGVQLYYPFYILFVIIIIWTAAAAFLKPQAAVMPQAADPVMPPVRPELRAKGAWLRTAMEANLYYQDPEVSLSSLAEKLKLHPHELSRVINTVFKKNFNDFINEYRVMDAARKMQELTYDNITLLGIGFEAGFNSQRTFNRVFKEMTGKTPADYKNSLKKELPNDKLATFPRTRPVILRSGSLPNWAPDKINHRYMFSNYLKTALRNVSRNKGYAFINVTGLAAGIAACLLIFLVIQYETSFDNFHAHKERIYRIATRFNRAAGVGYSRGICFPAGKQLRLDYPQLENVASISGAQGGLLTVVDGQNRPTQKKFKEDGLYFAEPQFFAMFNFPFLAGDPATALAAPNTAVLTQQAAEKYFGDWRTAMGRSLQYGGDKLCKVTGILKNFPANTDFPVQVAISFKTSANDTSSDWVSTSGDLNTYVSLPPSLPADKFSSYLVSFGKKHMPAEYAGKQAFVLQPLATVHSDKRFGNYNRSTFSQELVTALGVIGLFLLGIACINFINLATAQAVNRAKEVGVRKVLGSRKPQLVGQFLCESFIITLVAAAIAVIIAFGVLPMLNGLLQTNITLHFKRTAVLFLPAVVVLVTLLSGLYPAVVLSGFNPITALKSKLAGNSTRGISLRRVLVVFQFTVAQALIIGTLVVVSQMDYFRSAPMGFDKEAIVNISVPNDSVSLRKFNTLKQQLLELPGVKNVSFGTFSISDNSHWGSDFIFDHATKVTNFNADLKWADADVFKTYSLQMAAGSPYRPSDTVREFVVNETMVKMLGLRNPQDILGKQLSFWDGQLTGPVVGVVKDFNSTSMAKPMTAVVMAAWKDVYQNIAIKLQPQQARPTLASIAGLWTAAYPEKVFEYQFLDEKIASFYKQEDQLSTLYKLFAGIAVFISCLGLYGLVSFMAVQRTREIGIRKVLGASTVNIVYLFSKEFTPLIAIAFLIAAPLAYFFMQAWLQNFSFRISMGIGLFLITIIASTAIAWLTAGYRALQAAMANPVKSLRSE